MKPKQLTKYKCIKELTVVMPNGANIQYDNGREFNYSDINQLKKEVLNKHFDIVVNVDEINTIKNNKKSIVNENKLIKK